MKYSNYTIITNEITEIGHNGKTFSFEVKVLRTKGKPDHYFSNERIGSIVSPIEFFIFYAAISRLYLFLY